MKTIEIGGKTLTLEQVWAVSQGGVRVRISSQAKGKTLASRRYLERCTQEDDAIYGVNTGFGLLSNVRVKDEDLEQLQYNLLRSHAVGTGRDLEDRFVRAMLLLRAHALAQGYSGVRLGLIEKIVELINKDVIPLVPEQGSVGASGDLAPLAHLALVLIGEGRAKYKGQSYSGAVALQKAKITPIKLQAKEGLALINGTQFMSALGSLALLESERLSDFADIAGALTLEALRGTDIAFSQEIHAVRPHPGQIETARRMRLLLSSHRKSEIAKSHKDCGKVQDPYSLRCIPQVHGASKDVLKFVRDVIEREINSVTDNPLVFSRQKKILSGGNFHGQILAMALDFLSIAMAELASISEQRIEKLINPSISDLPPFLTKESGLNSGFMIVQVAAASLVSENKTLCHPASVDSIPTSADKEDHVSMGAWAARKCHQVIGNTKKVLSMEILSATQGIDFLKPLKTTSFLEKFYKEIRKKIKFAAQDRSFHQDLIEIEQMMFDHKMDFCPAFLRKERS